MRRSRPRYRQFYDGGPYEFGLAMLWLGFYHLSISDFDPKTTAGPREMVERFRDQFFPPE